MAVHPCTARQCPPQNDVLGQELARFNQKSTGSLPALSSAQGQHSDCATTRGYARATQ